MTGQMLLDAADLARRGLALARFVAMCVEYGEGTKGGRWGALFQLQLLFCTLGHDHEEAWRLAWAQVGRTPRARPWEGA